MLDEAGYEPVYKILDRLGLPRSFPDFTTTTYSNGTGFNVARTLALAQRYLSADILVQLSLEPDPGVSRASLYVITILLRSSLTYLFVFFFLIENNFLSFFFIGSLRKTKKVRLKCTLVKKNVSAKFYCDDPVRK